MFLLDFYILYLHLFIYSDGVGLAKWLAYMPLIQADRAEVLVCYIN